MDRRRFLVGVPAMLAIADAWAIPELDEIAPPLKGKFFSGASFDLVELRSKVVLVNFYSSYCKFCAYEIGNLETFYEQNNDKGFEVIVVGIDALSDRHRVERMLGIYNLPGIMVQDLEANGFGRRHATPTAFVIDRAGVLRHRVQGAKTPSQFREYVVPLLA
jgi:thiol-disulfide isomerase/thioredoxin